jgi:hypothetical protein
VEAFQARSSALRLATRHAALGDAAMVTRGTRRRGRSSARAGEPEQAVVERERC